MPAVDDPRLADALDHGEIDRLQRAYADALNRRAWDDLEALFHPDAVVDLDLVTRPSHRLEGPAGVSAFIAAAMDRFTFFQFVILNSHVTLHLDGDPDRARARVYMCELRQLAGEAERNDAFGLYQDTYRRGDDGWKIAQRSYRSMARFPPGEVFGLPPVQDAQP